MADCNTLFETFNKKIRLDNDRRVNLREKRNTLRDKVKAGFSQLKRLSLSEVTEEMEFQSQGSYVMDTIINPGKDEDEYDLDDGVYFAGTRRKDLDRPAPKEFHRFVIESIEQGKGDHEIEEVVKTKDTCVRVRFKGKKGDYNYHIDIPIYYATNPTTPELADKKKGWTVSNPVRFILWFEEKVQSGVKEEFFTNRAVYRDEYVKWLNDQRKADHQLRRIVRYLKAWGDNLKGDMPPGIVMTILAASDNNYSADVRDDISLRDTLVNIERWLKNNGFTCPRPTTPQGEDLFAGYSELQKQYFKKTLEDFITSANQAISSKNQKDACHKWQKHLGYRFPCHLAKDELENANVYATPPVIKSENQRSA